MIVLALTSVGSGEASAGSAPGEDPPAAPPPSGPDAPEPGGRGSGPVAATRDLVGALVAAVGRAGSFSVGAVGESVEGPGRSLARRSTAAAVNHPRPVASRSDLLAALKEHPRSPLIGGVTGAAMVAKLARRVGPLRFLAKRTPMWLVITAVPAIHASVTRGAEELALVASHLVHRSRGAGLVPDPERVRRVTVQLVSGATVDPDAEPRHAPLAVAWLQRALRATLPFSPGVATRDPGGLARATAAVDPATLAGGPPSAPALLNGDEQ